MFGRKPKQWSSVETNETVYRPIASVDQVDIESVIPGDSDTYGDFDLKLFVEGKLQTEYKADLLETDYTAVINNLLHSLFSLCTISLNGTQSCTLIARISRLPRPKATMPQTRTLQCPSDCSTKGICWAVIAQNPQKKLRRILLPMEQT